jgi:phospholipid transport system substrate-binding protein
MKTYWLVLAALLLLTIPGVADDAQATVDFVERKMNEALEILKSEDLDENAKKEQVRDITLGMFDVPYMAKQVIGRTHWPKFSKSQRQEFADLFLRQLESSYFDKMDIFREAHFEYGEPIDETKEGRKRKKYHIPSHVNYRDQRYKILYKLRQVDAGWRAYDVNVDGISVVITYKKQYDQILQEASPEELLAKMREKNMKLPAELEEMEKEFQETHGTNIVAAKSETKEKKN